MSKKLIVLALLVTVLLAEAAFAGGVYHEASCPSVDSTRMTRMKREAAVAGGLFPAPDCHPTLTVRYLGTTTGPFAGASPTYEQPARVDVRAYTRADGTPVRAHTRAAPRHD